MARWTPGYDYHNQKAGLGTILFVVLLTGLPFGLWAFRSFVNEFRFDQGCGGHLKRAADANSVVLAEEELKAALDYMEAHNMTQGNTTIFVYRPNQDVGFWYRNTKSAYDDLVKLDQKDRERNEVVNTTLLKLRESLLDHGGGSENVTMPPRIHNFPDHVGMFWWAWLAGAFWVIIGGWFVLCNIE